ncbi:hypothetical protein KEM52_000022 [Ascosphaera acerosa]|nr:hypothetical protein KEM52_000022 [Ascosphaera acerosa]
MISQRWLPPNLLFDIQRKYDAFLQEERRYVTEGKWDRFAPGSRLFVGNLPTERVTKRDLFHMFHKYGQLAQISIKQAFGFVQFIDPASCQRALQAQQNGIIRGRKIQLARNVPSRRSRSPDAVRGSPGKRDRGREREKGRDRDRDTSRTRDAGSGAINLSKANATVCRDRTRDDNGHRRRAEFRPARIATPPPARRSAYRERDRDRDRDRDRSRERDRKRSRTRSRSRSRSRSRNRSRSRGRGRDRARSLDKYDHRDRGRSRSRFSSGRYRSPSPRRGKRTAYDSDAEASMPRRPPGQVPDVQIIVLDDVERDFLFLVEKTFRERSLRSDVMFLSPRLKLSVVRERQILEGVLAISVVSRRSQYTGKIPLEVFDRSGGGNDVRWNEYPELSLTTAADVVFYARSVQAVSRFPQTRTQASDGPPLAPTTLGQQANLARLISGLDGKSLQSLIAALQQPTVQNPALAAFENRTPMGSVGSLRPPPPLISNPTAVTAAAAAAAAPGMNPLAIANLIHSASVAQQSSPMVSPLTSPPIRDSTAPPVYPVLQPSQPGLSMAPGALHGQRPQTAVPPAPPLPPPQLNPHSNLAELLSRQYASDAAGPSQVQQQASGGSEQAKPSQAVQNILDQLTRLQR